MELQQNDNRSETQRSSSEMSSRYLVMPYAYIKEMDSKKSRSTFGEV